MTVAATLLVSSRLTDRDPTGTVSGQLTGIKAAVNDRLHCGVNNVGGSRPMPFGISIADPKTAVHCSRRALAAFDLLDDRVEEGMAMAIDGEIYQDAYLAPLGPDSEIYLIPKIGGG
jgi:hypothetical protein